MKPPVRIVLDTNVLVSGLLKRTSPPAKILDHLLSGALTLVLETRLMDEYQRVLARPHLHIPAAEAWYILTFLSARAEWINAVRLAPEPAMIPDSADLPFAEAAVMGGAQALVTGNPRHFAFLTAYAVRVQTPGEFLSWFDQKGS